MHWLRDCILQSAWLRRVVESVTKFSCLTGDSPSPHKANFSKVRTIFRFYQLQWGCPTSMSWGYFSVGSLHAKLNVLQVQVTKHKTESKLRYCLPYKICSQIVPEGIAQSPQLLNKYVGGPTGNSVDISWSSSPGKKMTFYTVSLLEFRLLPTHSGKLAFRETLRF